MSGLPFNGNLNQTTDTVLQRLGRIQHFADFTDVTDVCTSHLRTKPGTFHSQRAIVADLATTGDRCGGLWAWDSASTTADDGRNVFQAVGTDPGRWHRIGWIAAEITEADLADSAHAINTTDKSNIFGCHGFVWTNDTNLPYWPQGSATTDPWVNWMKTITPSLPMTVIQIDTNLTDGTSNPTNQFQLPLDAGGTYNFTVDWGDGNTDTITSAADVATTHTYAAAGSYTVEITGQLDGWRFNNAGDKAKVTSVGQWHDQFAVGSDSGMFYGCTNLTSVPNTAVLADADGLRNIFRDCSVLNCDLSGWDTSLATSISGAFQGATVFNGNITTWNTSNVLSASGTFQNAVAFNQDISIWNMGNLHTLNQIFSGASSFNQPIGAWNLSGLTTIALVSTFQNASSFNHDLNMWDVSGINNLGSTFNGATAFNGNIDNWDVSNVTNFASAFRSASAFARDLSGWIVSSGTNFSLMFRDAVLFNSDLSSWVVTNATNLSNMFGGAALFTSDLSGWIVTNCTNFSSMFSDAAAFNSDLSSWIVTNGTNFQTMFRNCVNFTSDLSSWIVSNATTLLGMFQGASNFTSDLSSWLLNSINASFGLSNFGNNAGFTTAHLDAIYQGWDANKATWRTDLTPNFSPTQYTTAVSGTARGNLVAFGWTITDGGGI